MKDQELAEDLVQDCFVKLWEKKPMIKHPNALRSYLYVMVKNECLNFIKLKLKRQTREDNTTALNEISEPAVLDMIIIAETNHEVFQAISSLPPKMQRVFRMSYIEGKKNKEIAKELNLSIDTIKHHKSRALILLKQKLRPILLFILLIQSYWIV